VPNSAGRHKMPPRGNTLSGLALPEQSPSTQIYRVGDLTVDAGRRVVTRGDVVIPLPKLSFDLFLVLIRAAPNVVSIDEFMQRVWPGLVVSPETVSQRVKLLRDVIGDDPRDASYVAGVRGAGYRLIADVTREEVVRPTEDARPGKTPATAVTQTMTSPQTMTLPGGVSASPDISVRIKPRRRPLAIPLVVLAAAATIAVGFAVFRHYYHQVHDRVTVEGVATRAVAVLPFENLSSAHEDDYIALGVAEMVLNRLSAVPSLQVIARTSSFAAQGRDLDVKEIGRRLNADYLVLGSVQRSGDSLRVTTQLVDVTSGRQVKALHLDKTLQDLFSIEDEIADSVAASLALRMGDATGFHPEQARNVSLSAYLEYLQGRATLGHFKMVDMQAAADHFQNAIRIDPTFAAAYSSLADAKRWIKNDLNELNDAASKELVALTNKAIALDSGLGEAYVERAVLEDDMKLSEPDFRKGLDLSPSFGLGYTYFAEALNDWNRIEEAEAILDHSIRIDPLSPRATYAKAIITIRKLGHTPSSIRQAEALMNNVLAIDPDFSNALVRIAEIKAVQYGQFAAAIPMIERALRADPGAEWILENAVFMYAAANDAAAVRNLVAAGGDRFWYGQQLLANYEGDWRRAAHLEFNRPAWLADYEPDITPILAIQNYARKTRDFDRCLAHLRTRFHLKEGHELDDGLLDPGLAIAQILRDKGDIEAARKLGAQALQILEGSTSSWMLSNHAYRARAHLVSGDGDAALREIESSAQGEIGAVYPYWWTIRFDSMWDLIRDSPRFRALMARQQTYIDQQRALVDDMRRRGEIPARDAPAQSQNN
jgi:TolB-like protein/DNA-binding winged helix-turn-helix (wHTH) protein